MLTNNQREVKAGCATYVWRPLWSRERRDSAGIRCRVAAQATRYATGSGWRH